MVWIQLMRTHLKTGFNFCLSQTSYVNTAKSLEWVWPFSFWSCTVVLATLFQAVLKRATVRYYFKFFFDIMIIITTMQVKFVSQQEIFIIWPFHDFGIYFFQPCMLNLDINYLKYMATYKERRWLFWFSYFIEIHFHTYTCCLRVKKIPKFYI